MKQILKQTSWLMVGQILTKAVGFFYTIFLAKNLEVENFGLYTVAFAYFSIISAIADFGFNRFLIREISLQRLKINHLLWNIMILRLTLVSVLFGCFSVILYFLDNDSIRTNIILLATIAVLPQAIGLTFDAIFIAIKKLQFSSIILFLSTITMSLSGWILVSQGFGLVGAINGLIFGQLIYALGFFVLFSMKVGLHFPKIEVSVLKDALKGSLPYGILGILGLLYFRIDSIILSYLKGNFEAGIYGASYKFLETILFIPSSFAAALFPSMSKLHTESMFDLKKLYYKSIKIMLGLGLILFLGYFLILPEIIKAYLPNYKLAIDSLKILAISIPFIFVATPGVQVLLSSEKYLKNVVTLSIFTLAFNIILNLIFIPKFGFIAASWITVLSDILSFIVFFSLIQNSFSRKQD